MVSNIDDEPEWLHPFFRFFPHDPLSFYIVQYSTNLLNLGLELEKERDRERQLEY